MLGIDEIDTMTAREHFRCAGDMPGGIFTVTHKFKTAEVGNHAINKAHLSPSQGIRKKVSALRIQFGTVILFAGGGTDYTGAEIKLLVSCLKKTPGSWIVIKRYHGKHEHRIASNGRTWREIWDELFSPLGDRVIKLETPEGDAVAALADCTISGFSTMMTTAVASYKPAIALVTLKTRASLKAQTTLSQHPLSMIGIVPEIKEPENLTEYFNKTPDIEAIDRRLKPYNPMLALTAIENLLK